MHRPSTDFIYSHLQVILLFTFIMFEPLTLFNGAYKYPAWGDAMAWLMVTGVVMSIPIWALVVWIRSGKCDASL